MVEKSVKKEKEKKRKSFSSLYVYRVDVYVEISVCIDSENGTNGAFIVASFNSGGEKCKKRKRKIKKVILFFVCLQGRCLCGDLCLY